MIHRSGPRQCNELVFKAEIKVLWKEQQRPLKSFFFQFCEHVGIIANKGAV
jgi:hypothetical protein